MFDPFLKSFGQMMYPFAMLVSLMQMFLHLMLALGVYPAASDRAIRGRKLWFVGAGLWAFATLIGGIFTAGMYWVMHQSTLSPAGDADSDEES